MKGLEVVTVAGGLDTVFKLSVVINMLDNISRPANVAGRSVTDLQRNMSGMETASSSLVKAGTTMTAVGSMITAAVLAPVAATIDTQKALGDLKSVGIKDLNALEMAAEKFSNNWSETTKPQFISSAYDIKSAISSLSDEGVAKYTEMAGMTSQATKGTIGEMTNLFAVGYGIYKDYYSDLNDIQFGEMLSSGISATANIFRAEGKTISDAIQNLGSSATLAKRPMVEQLTVLGMLMQTMSGNEAGTKYRSFVKNAASAGKELGMSFLDSNNNLLGMTEILEKLRGKFGETLDMTEKMKIQKAFGDDEAVALVDALYTKTGTLNKNLGTMGDMMSKGTALTKEMADARNSSIGDDYQKSTHELHNMAETMGKELIPVLLPMMAKLTETIGKVTSWAKENKEAVRSIMTIALWLGIGLTAIGGFTTVLGGLIKAVSVTKTGFSLLKTAVSGIPSAFETMQIKALYAGDSIKAGFNNIKMGASMAATSIKNVGSSVLNFAKTAAINGANGIKTFVVSMGQMAAQGIRTVITAMTPMIASVWSFTAALLANPITWIVVGIVALIAIIILLVKNWDVIINKVPILGVIFNTIKNIALSVFNGIKNVAIMVFNAIKTVVVVVFNILKAVFMVYVAIVMTYIKIYLAVFKFIFNIIKTVVVGVFEALKTVFIVYVNIVKTVIGVIVVVFKTVFGTVKTIVIGVVDFIGGAFDKVGKVIGGVFEGVSTTFKGVANSIAKGLNFLIGGVNKFQVKIPDWVPLIGGKNFGFNISQIPMYAKGINYHPGGLAIVGDDGPEILNLPRGTSVTPREKTEKLLNREVKKVSFKEVMKQSESTKSKETVRDGSSKGNMTIQKVEINAQDRTLSEVFDELFAIFEMA